MSEGGHAMTENPKKITSFKRPEPPNIMDDPFAKNVLKQRELDFNSDKVLAQKRDAIKQVIQCLASKALFEYRVQGKYNQTMLGGVSFYLQYNEVHKTTRLVFDKNPSTWNDEEIIRDANNMEADMIMHKQAQDDVIDNPFTY